MASVAVAVNGCVPPTWSEAPFGVTFTAATMAGGVTGPLSLQLPKVCVAGDAHVPSDLRCSDCPSGSLPVSVTPM